MPRGRREVEVSKAFAIAWLLLFILTGVLVFHPVIFGVDLFPLAGILLAILIVLYEMRIAPALR